MVKVFERRAMVLEDDIEIDFYFEESHVYTVKEAEYKKLLGNNEEINLTVAGDKKYIYLIIDSIVYLEKYDRVSEATVKVRPRMIVIMGMICLLTGKSLSTFDFHTSYQKVDEQISFIDKKTMLFNDGEEIDQLKVLLDTIANASRDRKNLIFSLLDRWRKANYLTQENEDSYLYTDEAILAYFHCWELLGQEYYEDIKASIQTKTQAFVEDILSNDLYTIDQDTYNHVSSIIKMEFNNYLTVKPKILKMFHELGLFNLKSKALVERFLAHRNSIAHGRSSLYEDKAIFPLKPFFSHVKDIYEDIEPIRIATGRAISAYLGLSSWQNEWEEVMESELIPYEKVQQFLRGRIYENLSVADFEIGAANGVNLDCLISYLLKGTLKVHPFVQATKKYILDVTLNEENAYTILYVAAIIADCQDKEASTKSQTLIKELKKSSYLARFDMREVLKELQYQGLEPKWLKEFLLTQVRRPEQ